MVFCILALNAAYIWKCFPFQLSVKEISPRLYKCYMGTNYIFKQERKLFFIEMPSLSASGDMRSKEKQATPKVQSHSQNFTPTLFCNLSRSLPCSGQSWCTLPCQCFFETRPSVHQLRRVDSKHRFRFRFIPIIVWGISGLDFSYSHFIWREVG